MLLKSEICIWNLLIVPKTYISVQNSRLKPDCRHVTVSTMRIQETVTYRKSVQEMAINKNEMKYAYIRNTDLKY